MLVAIACLVAQAQALTIRVDARVTDDLRGVRGTMWIEGAGEPPMLANPLARLPQPQDDRTLFRTYPGAPDEGEMRWSPAPGGGWAFETRLPKRYGALGALPGRGLWANGGWYPQPLVDGAPPTADFEVTVSLPEGAVGVLGTSAGEGELAWSGRGERAPLAALRRGRLSAIEGATSRPVIFLQDGHRRRRRDALLTELLSELELPEAPPGAGPLVVVEAPQLRRLTRAAPGVVFLSDRALRLTGRLARYHRLGVARGLYTAALPVEDPWLRDLAADALVRDFARRVEARDAEDLLRWASWIPQVDDLLYDGSVPFVGELFGETFPGDPLRDDLVELFFDGTPGQVASVKIDYLLGGGTSLTLALELADGAPPADAIAQLGLGRALAIWRGPYPEQDLTLAVDRDALTVRITRDAPAWAPAEPVILEIDGERERWVAGPGPDEHTWLLDERPRRVALDPDDHVRELDESRGRWPARWTTILALYPHSVNLSDGTLAVTGSAALRRQYDTRRLYYGSLFTDASNLAGASLGYRYAFGPLLDRRARPQRVNAWVTPAILDEDFRPTPSGRLALGGGLSYTWDDRVSFDFPLRGKRFSVSATGGFVPSGDQVWSGLRAGAAGVTSPHPRVALAARASSGVAWGEVEHRLLALGGASSLAGLPADAGVGDARLVGAGELRVAPLRNVSVPLWLGWGSELQLSAGGEAGLLADARLVDGGREELLSAAGWTAGLSAIGDVFGARPTLMGVTAARVEWVQPALTTPAPVQVFLRWWQAF